MKPDSQVHADGLEDELKTCYNKDVDRVRDEEFPMLQGSLQTEDLQYQ